MPTIHDQQQSAISLIYLAHAVVYIHGSLHTTPLHRLARPSTPVHGMATPRKTDLIMRTGLKNQAGMAELIQG